MNDTPHLEQYEWLHVWHDHPTEPKNKEDKAKRVLFIGDSITHGSFPKCKNFLLDEYKSCALYLDYLTTSKGIDNPDILWEIDYMLGHCSYDLIHFNNGLHGMGLSEEDFDKYYEEAVCHILEKYPPEKVCLMTVTPLTKNGDTSTFRNEKVDARNVTVHRVAEKYGLAIDDLFSVVMGKSDIRSADGYHYTDEGYIMLGRAMADFIKSNI